MDGRSRMVVCAQSFREERMNFRQTVRVALVSWLMVLGVSMPALAQRTDRPSKVRVVGVVRDEFNAITLPGVPVEVVGGSEVVYTDVDGRYALELAPGAYELRVLLDGYQTRVLKLDVPGDRGTIQVDVGLSMTRFAETVTVTGTLETAALATSESQLIVRQRANVIS